MQMLRGTVIALLLWGGGLLCAQSIQPIAIPERPLLHLLPSAFTPAYQAGRQAVYSTSTRSAVREGATWYLFDPGAPEGPATRRVPLNLPEGQTPGASCLQGDYVYAASEKTILRRPLGGGAWEPWFTAPRCFEAFQVLDEQRVALVWVGEGRNRFNAITAELLTLWGTTFAEIWDTVSRERLRSWEVPQNHRRLVSRFKALTLGPIWLLSAEESCLIHFTSTAEVFHLDPKRGTLEPLPVPWPTLDANWVLKRMDGFPPSNSYAMPAWFLPFYTSVTPTQEGGFRFTYFIYPRREHLIAPLLRDQFEGFLRGPILLPDGMEPADQTPLHPSFFAADWTPGKSRLVDFRFAGAKDPNDALSPETRERMRPYTAQGTWLGLDQSVLPYPEILKMLQKAADLRSLPGKTVEPGASPAQTETSPKPAVKAAPPIKR